MTAIIMLFVAVLSHATLAAAAEAPAGRERRLERAVVRGVADDQSSLSVAHDDTALTIVAGKEFKQRLGTLRAGDVVDLRVADEPAVLKDVAASDVITTSLEHRIGLLLAALGMLFLVAFAATRANVRTLVLGKDGRYSTSKFQMAAWFAVVIVTYAAVVSIRSWAGGARLLGGVNMPQNLLMLSGISAFTLVAAKGITMHNIEKGGAGAKPDAGTPQTSSRAFLANLVENDQGNPDLGDFQMLVVTLLAIAVYVVQIFAFLGSMEKLQIVTIPDLDTTILATFGIGQGAYLAKKYAGKDGL